MRIIERIRRNIGIATVRRGTIDAATKTLADYYIKGGGVYLEHTDNGGIRMSFLPPDVMRAIDTLDWKLGDSPRSSSGVIPAKHDGAARL